MVTSLRLLLLACLASTVLLVPSAHAQSTGDYHGYTYDSTFFIGGMTVNRTALLPVVHDSLHMSVIHFYGIPSYSDSAHAFQHLATGDSGVYNLKQLIPVLSSLGMGISAPTGRTDGLIRASHVRESYLDRDTVYAHWSWNSPVDTTLTTRDTNAVLHDKLFAWGRTLPRDPTGNDTAHLVAANPNYFNDALVPDGPSYYAMLDSISGPSGYADSSHYFRLSFAVKIDETSTYFRDSVGDADTLAYAILYRRDTTGQSDTSCWCNIWVPWRVVGLTKRDYLDSRHAGDGYRAFGTTFTDTEYGGLPAAWFQWPNNRSDTVFVDTTHPTVGQYCDSIAGTLPGAYNMGTIPAPENTNLTYRLFSTRRVDVTFLRGTLSNQFGVSLRNGAFDTLIREDINNVYTDSLNGVLRTFGTMDEPGLPNYRGLGHVARTMQRSMFDHDPGETRQTSTIFFAEYDDLRISSNDFDSTDVKTIQATIYDRYFDFQGDFPMPARYANPDSMSVFATDTLYNMAHADELDTNGNLRHRTRNIAGTSLDDYAWFTTTSQAQLGSSADRYGVPTEGGHPPWVSGLARLVDVARFRYASQTRPASPVYSLIGVHAWIPVEKTANGYPVRYYPGLGIRPPAPESIRLQTWLSMNSGVTAVSFSEMEYTGEQMGPLRIDSTAVANNATHAEDYWAPVAYKNPQLNFPTMWVGFNKRFNAMRDVADDLYRIDTLVGWKNLLFNQEQMSVYDQSLSFDDMPMLDTVMTEMAKRYERDSVGGYVDSTGVYDPRSETYLEVTHYRPGRGDADGYNRYCRYLLLTNRRLYPVDTLTYSQAATDKFDSVAPPAYTFSRHGLGAIDVRRPTIVLKNSTSVLADSFVVTKVLDTTWTRTACVGDTLRLDWLEPGEGELYRLTPTSPGTSHIGTAWANAVHSENLSTDSSAGDRVVVYDRDSVIYMRTVSPSGQLSPEWMVSDPSDTVASTRRDCVNPAFATMRDHSEALVVWERRNPATDSSEVRACRVGMDSTGIDPTDFCRYTLSAPSYFDEGVWMRRTPAVVGLDSGYVVAYANPPKGIDVVAIAAEVCGVISNADTATVTNLHATQSQIDTSLGSTCLLPTLAQVPSLETVETGGAVGYGGYGIEGPSSPFEGHIVHLAYQQGESVDADGQNIIYHRIAVRFPYAGQPQLWVLDPELVTAGLHGCSYRRPSIAADSTRIGIAFQRRGYPNDETVALRFRPVGFDSTMSWRRWWLTPVYYFASSNPYYRGWHEYPSLTEFPLVPTSELQANPTGVLVFQWIAPPSYPLFMYHFGDFAPTRFIDGVFPSMTLVPLVSGRSEALAATSVLHMGSAAAKFHSTRLWGGTNEYYPLMLFNHPNEPQPSLYQPLSGATISSELVLSSDSGCVARSSGGGFRWKKFICDTCHTELGGPGPPDTFFGPPIVIVPSIRTVDDATNAIARTSVFTPDGSGVTITRFVTGEQDVIPWLNTQPPDSGQPADIGYFCELVRVSDSMVVWRSDTISARDVGPYEYEDDMTVPPAYLAPGTDVFLRMRAEPTANMVYAVSADFRFAYDSSGTVAFQKVRSIPRSPEAEAAAESAMTLAVVPNPLRGAVGDLHITVRQAGTVTLAVYDLLGRRVRLLPTLEAASPGEYTTGLAMEGVPEGSYVVVAHSGGETRSVRFSVVR